MDFDRYAKLCSEAADLRLLAGDVSGPHSARALHKLAADCEAEAAALLRRVGEASPNDLNRVVW